jgi:hypothetical protein
VPTNRPTSPGWARVSSYKYKRPPPKDGRCMSEFGGRADVQQIRVIAVVMNAVLLNSAKRRPLATNENGPEGPSLLILLYQLSCFLASCHANQAQQAGAEEPDGGGNGHNFQTHVIPVKGASVTGAAHASCLDMRQDNPG